MAEETGQDKTIPPSERRRQEARLQGQVAVSAELSAGLLLLAGVAILWWGGSRMAIGLFDLLREDFSTFLYREMDTVQAAALLSAMLLKGAGLLAVLMGLLFVLSLAVGALQAGFYFTPELLLPNFERISPTAGFSRMFSLAATVKGLLAVLKVAAVAAVALWVLKGKAGLIAGAGEGSLMSASVTAWGVAIRLALVVAMAMLVLGALDYGYQRWRHEMSLWMTHQEFKEEMKREEGDPQVKARIRKLQREAARKRMWEEVPKATVVVTNPTHLAVALRYDRGTMPAPRVVAKGAGHVAERIKDMARRHAIPVVERKPLAQALFKGAGIGQEIPLALYHAVAELMAHVYRLKGVA